MAHFPAAILETIQSTRPWDTKAAERHLGGPWKPLVCYYVLEGVTTFKGIRNLMPECDKLSLHFALEELQASGVLQKVGTTGMPPEPQYGFTDLGLKLRGVYEALWQWTMDERTAD